MKVNHGLHLYMLLLIFVYDVFDNLSVFYGPIKKLNLSASVTSCVLVQHCAQIGNQGVTSHKTRSRQQFRSETKLMFI